MIDYYCYRAHIGNPIGDNWLSVTQEQYDEFRISPEYTELRNQSTDGRVRFNTATIPAAPRQSPTALNASPTNAALTAFTKSIKRDVTAFPTLKDEWYQDSWHQDFENQCSAQDFEDVIDPNYVPPDATAIKLFALKQKFMYAALNSKVQTSKGKEIVWKHQSTKDAQKAYDELRKYHSCSTAATLSARDIQAYFTTV